jgi:hypothetical protein
MSANRYERELIDRIRDVLLENWDPIGIGNNPNLRNEYDLYIPRILHILKKVSVNKSNIFLCLQEIEIHIMEIPEDPKRIDLTAQILLNLVSHNL